MPERHFPYGTKREMKEISDERDGKVDNSASLTRKRQRARKQWQVKIRGPFVGLSRLNANTSLGRAYNLFFSPAREEREREPFPAGPREGLKFSLCARPTLPYSRLVAGRVMERHTSQPTSQERIRPRLIALHFPLFRCASWSAGVFNC